MSKILLFGPCPLPITGQSIAFMEVYNNYLPSERILCNTTKYGENKLLNSISCAFRILFLFLFKKFDTIYFTCTRSKWGFIKDLELLFLAFLFNKRVVNHLHGADFKAFYDSQSGLLKTLIYWAYSKIETSIILLPPMRSQFSDFPKMKIETVRNSYSSEYENINIDVDAKKLQILYLSNIIESKGILIFLEAVANILLQFPLITVKIAGNPMADEISSIKEIKDKFQTKLKILQYQFPDRVDYLGSIRGTLKQQVLMESSIFVLPTFYKTEAFPISIIEAMRFGNAIIATKHNYLEAVVKKENGCTIVPKSSFDLEIKLSCLLNDKIKLRNIQIHNILEAKEKYNPGLYNKRIKVIIDR